MADSPGENRSPTPALQLRRTKPPRPRQAAARLKGRHVAALMAVAAAVGGLPGTASASATGAMKSSQDVTVLCRKDDHLITRTGVDIRNNNFQGEPECLTNWNDNPGFMITRSGAHTPWAAFPNTFVGCEISVCSPDSGMPIQVKNIKALSTTWRFVPAKRWQGNAAYDIWFNPWYRTSGQDTGAEIMIWLDWNKLYFPPGPIVQIDGTRWLVSSWTMFRGKGKSWHYLRFWRLGKVTSVRGLNLMPFLTFAERYRYTLKPAWWLTGIEAGYELWSGGVGTHTQLFAVNLKSKLKPPVVKKPQPKPTPKPTLPPAPTPSALPTTPSPQPTTPSPQPTATATATA
jgi:hypothetical protein